MRSTCIHLALLVAAALAACGAEDEPPAAERSGVTASYAEVVLLYHQEVTDREEEEAPSEPFAISARFVRGSVSDRSAVGLLLGEDLPQADVDTEECTPVEAVGVRQASALLDPAEFLDAGDLLVSLDGEEARIADWSFPPVYGQVSGVLYGSDEALGVPYRPQREYRISGSGSGQIGAFEVALVAPDELAALMVGGAEVGLEPVRVETGGPLEVRWEPGETGAEVLVELSWTHFGSEQQVVCRSRDDGAVDVPAAAAARLADDPGVTDARLSVHRILRAPLSAEGLDEGEARFVVSVTVPLR